MTAARGAVSFSFFNGSDAHLPQPKKKQLLNLFFVLIFAPLSCPHFPLILIPFIAFLGVS
jgi:hypothetical protein